MEKVIQQLNEFLDGDDNSEYFCYQEEFDNPKPTDTELRLSINGRFNFTLMFPDMLFHRCDLHVPRLTLVPFDRLLLPTASTHFLL
jgi:hypothetical protein